MKTIVLNHKSYLNYEEIKKYKEELTNLQYKKDINIIIMPNIAYLSLFENSKIQIGAQNFYSYNFGSYTGETSLEILKSLNILYTLVGHPERITLRLDSYEQIKDKLFRSLNSGFNTILCVGHNESVKILKKELKYYFKGIEVNAFRNLIIAFEPSSKIEGDYIDLHEIEIVKKFIKDYINKNYEIDIPFIYGGSVNKENIKDILKITDGVMLGRNSTKINEIKELLDKINQE